MSAEFPNSAEVRAWAQSKRAGAGVAMCGSLPYFVILGWNRAHPDRPYVKSQAYHGTVAGYTTKGCRCERCGEVGRAYRRALDNIGRAERDDALADDLAGGAA